jgi:hypothetical protein
MPSPVDEAAILRLERPHPNLINDQIGRTPVVLALASDQKSFVAFERPTNSARFTLQDDVLSAQGRFYDFSGRDLSDPSRRLRAIPALQEFWHSWGTFHPGTTAD